MTVRYVSNKNHIMLAFKQLHGTANRNVHFENPQKHCEKHLRTVCRIKLSICEKKYMKSDFATCQNSRQHQHYLATMVGHNMTLMKWLLEIRGPFTLFLAFLCSSSSPISLLQLQCSVIVFPAARVLQSCCYRPPCHGVMLGPILAPCIPMYACYNTVYIVYNITRSTVSSTW